MVIILIFSFVNVEKTPTHFNEIKKSFLPFFKVRKMKKIYEPFLSKAASSLSRRKISFNLE